MSDLEKAARLALEAQGRYERETHEKAITALRQATDQPAQQSAERGEPVGQLMEETYGRGQVLWFNKPDDLSMLYTSPPASKPWVGLTNKQIDLAIAELGLNYLADVANNRAVLRELCRKAANAKEEA